MDFVDFGGIGQFINKNAANKKKIGFSLSFNDWNSFNVGHHFQWALGNLLGIRQGAKNKESDEKIKIKTFKVIISWLDSFLKENFSNSKEINKQLWLNDESALEIKIEVMFNLEKALSKKESRYADLLYTQPDICTYLNGVKLFSIKSDQNEEYDDYETLEEKGIKSFIDGSPARIFLNNNIKFNTLNELYENIHTALKEQTPEESLDRLFHQVERQGIELKKTNIPQVESNNIAKAGDKEIISTLNLSDFRGRNNGLEIFPSFSAKEMGNLQKLVSDQGRLADDSGSLILLEAIGDTLRAACKSLFDKPKYLAAYRIYPKRFVSEFDILGTDQNDPYGAGALNILREAKTRQKLSRFCKELGADFEFFVGDTDSEVGGFLKVKNKDDSGDNTRKSFSYRDIGFGWSQVVPVLFELIKEEFTFFMCEQPELHLHPTAQSQLMEVILKIFSENRERKNDSPFFGGKKIFFELHSEQMILRLLKRIKQKGDNKNLGPWLNEELFSILFVEKRNGKTDIREIKIRENGTLSKEWPGGILGSAISDL